MRQVLRASLAVVMYVEKDLPARECIYTFFCTGIPFVDLIILSQFLRTVLNFTRPSAVTTLDIATPSVLKIYMFFRCKAMLEEAIQAKAVRHFL